MIQDKDTALVFRPISQGDSGVLVDCDVSQKAPRPVVPTSLRQEVIKNLHNLAHSGVRTTNTLVKERFVWEKMIKDINTFVNQCLHCQRSKVNRHTKSPFKHITPPSAKFEHINIDLIGPLPPSENMRYCLTMIDRYSRCPEAVPIPDIRAETVARAFSDNWVARYGVPARLTSDRGSQFDCGLFRGS